MRVSRMASVSTHRPCRCPLTNKRRIALAVSASALLLGGAAFAAEEPTSKSDAAPAADTAATPDAASDTRGLQRAENAQTSPTSAAPSTQSDHSRQDGAKSRKGGKGQKNAATPESAPTSLPSTTAQVQPEDRLCHLEQAPGSRVRKTVCTTAAEQNANAKNGQEFLKRAYEDSIHPSPNPSTFTQAGR